MKDRAFTVKSILTGILFSLILAIFTYRSTSLDQTSLVLNYLSIFGMLMLASVSFAWNATFGRISSLSFSTKELAVVAAIVLTTSWIPSFMAHYTPAMIQSYQKSLVDQKWKEAKTKEHLPSDLMVVGDGETEDDTIHTGFMQGLGDDKTFSDIPSDAWFPALANWAPIIIFFIMGGTLAFVSQQQEINWQIVVHFRVELSLLGKYVGNCSHFLKVSTCIPLQC